MHDNKAIVRRFIEEVINQGHIDDAGEFVWEDVVEQVPFPGQGPGLNGLKDVLRGMRTAFPDLRFSVEEQIAEGDKVLTRFEWTGTHQAEFLGVPATGKTVKVWGMVVDRLVGGKIKDTRIIMDVFGLMAQFGVLGGPPASNSAPTVANREAPANNFTPRAQQALRLARDEAVRFGHDQVRPEHLLLGLVVLGRGVALTVLVKLGITVDNLRVETEKVVGKVCHPKLPLSTSYPPETTRILARAARKAQSLNHSYIGTEHIFLGLLEEDGAVGTVFKNFNIDAAAVHAEILNELDPFKKP